jgi:PPK2 family polyphosphate:nucleotide phosphotransferase
MESAMDFRKQLMVRPGSNVRLANFDPNYDAGYGEEKAIGGLERYEAKLTQMQRLLHGNGTKALLIVLQGIDASGKDGTCWQVIGAMNPLGVKTTSFKQPSPEERAHDFLWRVHPHAPGKGEVAVFNRSHYEDVLVVRVHGLVPKQKWRKRYAMINDFEKLLHVDHDTTILKFFLNISKEEQLRRFKDRLEDPKAQWKISESEYTDRDNWDAYVKAFEDVLSKCSTKHGPWFVIPSNKKWFRNLAVSQIIADTIEDMRLTLPKPAVDLAAIRRLYHAELAESRAGDSSKGKAGGKGS